MNENQCVRSINKGSAQVEPKHDETVPSLNEALSGLNEAGEEFARALESALIEQALSRAKAREDDLERRIAALEKKVQEAVKPLAPADVSPSKEGEEHILVAPIRGIDEGGRLILGDQRILSAEALKI